jgi:hypothetical protein
MSAETVPRLPAIKSVHVAHGSTQQELPENEPEKKEERLHKATSYIARVRLGSVHKQPRPGDVYRPRTSAGPGRFSIARPLGDHDLLVSVCKKIIYNACRSNADIIMQHLHRADS